ncbi:type II toxin-antitoxin system PemK/MazF family toxin [Mycobacterium helveticum]|uniref:Type II toxin-antitoxin system PemK/MazF family toxin n=1 Tax=Mycobacterium helveticum TaxID=2592811 RepID=A0A557XLM3_9MYCO|nr:type II toxin-antitoxin system PemK/MazF family toxin [Mycobacterium helveticum]TVS86724.1 type II toxin-antitoxin system PemK/MazF family toxin [Mycobacterium helveticum]
MSGKGRQQAHFRRPTSPGPAAGPPSGPVLIVQSDPYNASRLAKVLAALITSNNALAAMHGNVFLPAAVSGLRRDSVVNVTALITLNKTGLSDSAGRVPPNRMRDVDRGPRGVLAL